MIKHRLENLANIPLKLVWHENKTTYLSVKKMGRGFLLRVHRLFYDAPTPVLEALLKYAIKRDKGAKAVIKQMAHLYFSKTPGKAKALQAVGKYYNLFEILEQMQKILPVVEVTIGWSDRKREGRFRSITFGAYDPHTRQIRINPILDDVEVPLYFLEYIVYHEMLHAVCPSQMGMGGRCSIHTKEFRKMERQFPLFEEAKSWEKNSLTFFKKRQICGRP